MEKQSLRKKILAHAKPVVHDEDANSFAKLFFFPPEFIAFQGHFPNMPVLPAIVQILMAELTIAEAFGITMSLNAVTQAKFSAPIEPNNEILCIVNQKNESQWNVKINVKDTLAASFCIQGEQ